MLVLTPSRECDQADRFKRRVGLQRLCYFVPVQVGHADIDDRDVRPEGLHHRQRRTAVIRYANLMPVKAEQEGQAVGTIAAVVGNQDAMATLDPQLYIVMPARPRSPTPSGAIAR